MSQSALEIISRDLHSPSTLGHSRYDIVGVGYPLVDLVAATTDAELASLGLARGGTLLSTREDERADAHAQLLAALLGGRGSVAAGGSTLNSARVASWLLRGGAGRVGFVGRVGSDAFADALVGAMRIDGVEPLLERAGGGGGGGEGERTGASAVLVTGGERSLLTYLGASSALSERFVLGSGPSAAAAGADAAPASAARAALAGAACVVTCGFTCQRPAHAAIALELGRRCRAGARSFVLNVGSAFVAARHAAQITALAALADIVVGNEDELAALAGTAAGTSSGAPAGAAADAALRLAALDAEPGGPGEPGEPGGAAAPRRDLRVVVVTRGARPTLVARWRRGAAAALAEVPLGARDVAPPGELVDDTGAGDAFLGGLVAARLRGLPLRASVRVAQWAAAHVVRRRGATFDRAERCPFLPPEAPGGAAWRDAWAGDDGL